MRAATEGSLPPVMPEGNLVEVPGREVRQRSPGEQMVESFPSRQRQPPCKTNKEMSDEAADAAALTYLGLRPFRRSFRFKFILAVGVLLPALIHHVAFHWAMRAFLGRTCALGRRVSWSFS